MEEAERLQEEARLAIMEGERLAAEEIPEIPVELDDLTHGRVHLVEEVSDYLYYSLDSWGRVNAGSLESPCYQS